MTRPPLDPRNRPLSQHPPGKAVLVSWAMMAAVFLLVWAASRPWLGALALAAGVGLVVLGRRARRLARCLRECRRLVVPLGRHGYVTVGWARGCPPE
jgi:Flp pilus assembly protein TadB